MFDDKPGPLRYLGYAFGRRLPDEMRDWVRKDLTGEAALLRHLVRSMVPLLPVFAGGLPLPGPIFLRLSTTLLGVILALIYSFAFMDLNRRRRLSQHGLPEELEAARAARRHLRARLQYESLHPRTQ